MAYMNQERKSELAPKIKAVLKKYGMKGTIGVRDYRSLVVNIKEGALDLIGNANRYNKMISERRGTHFYECGDYLQVNQFYAADWAKEVGDNKISKFYEELIAAMNGKGCSVQNYDNSDSMIDYFDVGWYIDINVGRWNKPYQLAA